VSKHLATVAGTELHWVEAGPTSASVDAAVAAPPLVLLHGLNDSHRTWRRAAPELAKTRRVLMLDLPGHGLSGRPDAAYGLFWYAKVVAAWLAHLGLEQVDLVGHSYGGGVAQTALMECRDKIRRLGLVSSGGLGREVGLPVRLMAAPHVVERLGQRLMSHGTRIYLMTGARGAFAPEDIDWLSWANGMPGTARATGRTVRDVVDLGGQRRSFMEHAHTLELPPVALFWGDRDRIVPLSHGLELQARTHSVEMTTFMGCGHFPHLESSHQFAAALVQYLDAPNVRPARLRASPEAARASVPVAEPSLVPSTA
jgi:pimeloyl-ACP methyl ester carboxylesterase